MGGAAGAAADPVHVLVAFGRVLSKVDPGAEHAADVGVTLVEAFMNDGVDEGRTWREGTPSGQSQGGAEVPECLPITMKEHALVVMVVILVCDFLLPVCVPLPQLLIHHLLNLQSSKETFATEGFFLLQDHEHLSGLLPHLDDVVAAEDSARVPAIAVLSNGALQLRRKQPHNE